MCLAYDDCKYFTWDEPNSAEPCILCSDYCGIAGHSTCRVYEEKSTSTSWITLPNNIPDMPTGWVFTMTAGKKSVWVTILVL